MGRKIGKSDESIDSGDIRQELEQLNQVVDHLDKQVIAVTQEVTSLRSDVKTILHLLQNIKTIPEATVLTGGTSSTGKSLPPTAGILKSTTGERTPPVNRVAFVDRPRKDFHEKERASRCHSCENVRACSYGDEDNRDSSQKDPLLAGKEPPLSRYSPLFPRQNSNGALRTSDRKVVRIKDYDHDVSTQSATRGDSGIDMGREYEADKLQLPKVLSTDLWLQPWEAGFALNAILKACQSHCQKQKHTYLYATHSLIQTTTATLPWNSYSTDWKGFAAQYSSLL